VFLYPGILDLYGLLELDGLLGQLFRLEVRVSGLNLAGVIPTVRPLLTIRASIFSYE
jgi:hypothetical protein